MGHDAHTAHPNTAASLRHNLDRLGLPGAALLRRAGLLTDPPLADLPLSTPSLRRISRRALLDVKAEAARQLANPSLGFHLGQHAHLSDFDLLGAAVQHAPTLEGALHMGLRFMSIWEQGVHVQLVHHAHTTQLLYQNLTPADPLAHAIDSQQSLLFIANAAHDLLCAAGARGAPITLHCACKAPTDPHTLSLLQQTPHDLRFNQPAWSVELPRALLSTPLPPLHPAAASLLTDALSNALSQLTPAPDDARASLHAALTPCLPDTPNIESVSKRLGVSSRKLQAQLQALGTSFSQEVATLRLRRAQHLLSATDQPIKAVAAALGFQSVAAFSRFFRLHTGHPPTTYRARAHHLPPSPHRA